MTRVITSEDCGNSPKNLFVEKLAIAFAALDHEFILNSVADNIRWHLIGDTVIEGKAQLAQVLGTMKNVLTEEITIHHIATHGKVGAVNGTITQTNGKMFAFCDMVEFNGAKATRIQEITTYMIEVH